MSQRQWKSLMGFKEGRDVVPPADGQVALIATWGKVGVGALVSKLETVGDGVTEAGTSKKRTHRE